MTRRGGVARAALGLLSAALLVAALGACSDDDGPDRSAPSSTTTVTYTFTGDPQSPFCQLVRTNATATTVDVSAPGKTPAELDAGFRELLAQLQHAADVAPPELREDAALVAVGMGAYVDALRAAGFDNDALSRSDQGIEVAAAINDPSFQVAGDRIEAYKQQVCGL